MKRKRKLLDLDCDACCRGPFKTLYFINEKTVCEQCRNVELMELIKLALMPVQKYEEE